MPDDARFDDRHRIETEILDEPGIIQGPIGGDASDQADGLFNLAAVLDDAHVVLAMATDSVK
jgi:hypothetical protein